MYNEALCCSLLIALGFVLGFTLSPRCKTTALVLVMRYLLYILLIVVLALALTTIGPALFPKEVTVPAKRIYCEKLSHSFSGMNVGLFTKLRAQDIYYGGILQNISQNTAKELFPWIETYDERGEIIVWFRGFVPRAAVRAANNATISGTDTNEEIFCFSIFPKDALEGVSKIYTDHRTH